MAGRDVRLRFHCPSTVLCRSSVSVDPFHCNALICPRMFMNRTKLGHDVNGIMHPLLFSNLYKLLPDQTDHKMNENATVHEVR